MTTLTETPQWPILRTHAKRMRSIHLMDLFENQPNRANAFHIELPGLYVDFSKQRLDPAIQQTLVALAKVCRLDEAIEQLFNGAAVNQSEQRPALHTLLRAFNGSSSTDELAELKTLVNEGWHQMARLVRAIHRGHKRGATNRSFTDVVNIGIGGSDLGPRLVCEALDNEYKPSLNVHFASSIDGLELERLLHDLDPERTLFVIVSKTFTTLETLTNAKKARAWLQQRLPAAEAWTAHCIGVSHNDQGMDEFGISPQHQLPMWSWVGGRYSLWSPAGVSIALAFGMGCFEQLLRGAYAMDCHYRETDYFTNLPVMLALIDIWNSQFMGSSSLAFVPYDYGLSLLPDFLQQLYMESNGKRVTQTGGAVNYATQPIVWGGLGSNAQHAFFQLLHQGTHSVPVEFIVPMPNAGREQSSAFLPAANALAQAQALMSGTMDQTAPAFKHYPGNQPSTMVLLETLDAYHLGLLLACHEHRVYTESVIWGINAFDQWGVELGKTCAKSLMDYFESNQRLDTDPSTCVLAKRFKALQNA